MITCRKCQREAGTKHLHCQHHLVHIETQTHTVLRTFVPYPQTSTPPRRLLMLANPQVGMPTHTEVNAERLLPHGASASLSMCCVRDIPYIIHGPESECSSARLYLPAHPASALISGLLDPAHDLCRGASASPTCMPTSVYRGGKLPSLPLLPCLFGL
jgi:hypothetical protein